MGLSFHLSGQNIRWLRNKKGPSSHLVGHIPCCGLLITLAVNTLELMLMVFGCANLDNCRPALIKKHTEINGLPALLYWITFELRQFAFCPFLPVQGSVGQEIQSVALRLSRSPQANIQRHCPCWCFDVHVCWWLVQALQKLSAKSVIVAWI